MNILFFFYKNMENSEFDESFEKSKLGDCDAMYDIAWMFRHDKQDYTKSAEWFLKAAESGHINAMFIIGCIYNDGNGLKQNYIKAIEWWIKAAELEHQSAIESLDIRLKKSDVLCEFITNQMNELGEKLEEKNKSLENKIDIIMQHIEAMPDGPLMKEALEDFTSRIDNKQ